nr:MAG TPA: hypothetical protein [Caudoviricetes sp.]
MKNTLQFNVCEFAPIKTTVWTTPKVTILLKHDDDINKDILFITSTKDKYPVEIIRLSDYIDVEMITDETILITGIYDCKSIVVHSNGTIKMKIEL